MKMNTYMTYTDELFAVRPATWIEKSNSGFMLKCKKVVQFSRAALTNKINCEKHSTLTHDTSKLLLSLPVKFLFLMMMGFFHGC